LGAAFNSWTADKFSRKYSIQFASVIFIIGAALSAGSVNFGMFVAARCFIGWGIGMLISVIPMYGANAFHFLSLCKAKHFIQPRQEDLPWALLTSKTGISPK
jgi:MFS family permease